MEVSGRRSDNDNNVGKAVERGLCVPCKNEHATTRADGICRECKEYMCNTCFRHHLKARQCRKHVLIDTSYSLVSSNIGDEDSEDCEHHEKEKIKYYCRSHDIVGCGDCMIAEHSACKPEFIKDVSNNFQKNEEFKILVRKIEKLVSTIKDSENATQDDKRETKTMYEVALKKIRKFKADINEYLDKAEADVIGELNRLKSENEDLLAKLEKNCKLISSKLDEVRQRINTDVYKGGKLFINSVHCKPDVLDIEHAVAKLQIENDIKKVAFTPNNQLRNIVASGIKLGNFEDREFVDVKPKFLEKVQNEFGMKSKKKVAMKKNEEIRPESEVAGALESPVQDKKKDDDIVFETFYHHSGKEFQCIYQSGMRFYLDDLKSKEWVPFPKLWYNEGLLVTNTLLKNEKEHKNGKRESNQGQSFATKCSNSGQGRGSGNSGDDREGYLIHPAKGRICTYIFYKKQTVHMYFDRETGSWVRMPIAWELHHEMVKNLVDQIVEKVPSWGDRHDILALLRACNYDPDECISIYLHLERDEWMTRNKEKK